MMLSFFQEIKIFIYYIMSRQRAGLEKYRRGYGCGCPPSFTIAPIVVVGGAGTPDTGTLTQITIPGVLVESGYPINPPVPPITLDDGDVPIPMGSTNFYFYGVNYSSNLYWSSNNALVFGTTSSILEVNISGNLLPAILLGNYERQLRTFGYSNFANSYYSITTILVTFYDYFTNLITDPTYQYKIRLIKENVGAQNQFVEVYVISSPPSPGYSSAIASYPSGTTDTNGNSIDPTKNSPYNITNGTAFSNPCGATFSLASPPANNSFVFSSNSTGSVWAFTNNAHVSV